MVDCFLKRSRLYHHRASILAEVESLSRGLLFWRSFTHWVGGMGVLVFVMTVIPLGITVPCIFCAQRFPGRWSASWCPA